MQDNDRDEVLEALRRQLDREQQLEQQRPALIAAGIEAMKRLIPVAQRDHGASRVIGRFLLGLYNGKAYPFDLVSLRNLDDELFEDCMTVLRMDQRPQREVHEYFKNGGEIWNDFKVRFGGKKR